jgi:hypothetical protein
MILPIQFSGSEPTSSDKPKVVTHCSAQYPRSIPDNVQESSVTADSRRVSRYRDGLGRERGVNHEQARREAPNGFPAWVVARLGPHSDVL